MRRGVPHLFFFFDGMGRMALQAKNGCYYKLQIVTCVFLLVIYSLLTSCCRHVPLLFLLILFSDADGHL